MMLTDDEVQAELSQKGINTSPIASFDSQGLINLLPGDSTMAKFDFTIEAGSDVVITVEQENLLAVAEAFSFVVKNETTGETFIVAKSDSSQGGLIAGALGLDVLGAVNSGNGLRLDINDLPPGNYSVEVQADSSKLADILKTIKLEDLGNNTVNGLVQDTVKGLVKEILINPNNVGALEGILKQATLGQVLALAKKTPIEGSLITAVEVVLDNFLIKAIAGDLLNSSVADILAGNAGGLLGSTVLDLLSPVITPLLNALMGLGDGLGEFIYDDLVEPLIDDILVGLLLDSTGLGDGLNGVLGGVNNLLASLGLSGVLPALDDLLKLVADNILSNPLTLFPDISADVYEINSKTYHVEGNVTEDSDNGTHADILNGAKLTEVSVDGKPVVTLDQVDAGGTYAEIEGVYGTLKIYEDGTFSYQSNNVIGESIIQDVFTYTVTDGDGHSETATLTVNIDTVNEVINFIDSTDGQLIQGGAGDDVITGSSGADTAVYHVLDNADNTGGNGHDTWTNFSMDEGDKINVSDLLSGNTSLQDAISIEEDDNGNVVLKIDRDGASNNVYQSEVFLTLEGVTLTDKLLDELFNNSHLL